MKIELAIERLVLDADAGIDPRALRRALVAALTQRLTAAPPALTGYAVPAVRAVAPIAAARDAATFGDGIAHAVHGALLPPRGAA